MTEVVGFTPRDTEVIIQMVRQFRNHTEKIETKTQPFYRREVDVAKVTEVITARSGTTPGTGKAESLDLPNADDTGLYEYSPVVNWFATAIEVDTYVSVARTTTGTWVIIAADCPDP